MSYKARCVALALAALSMQVVCASPDTIPIAYFLLLRDITARTTKNNVNEHHEQGVDHAQHNNNTSGYFFLDTFQASLEEGFFSGIQLGVAACFYQLLYQLSTECFTFIPRIAHLGKNLVARFVNYCTHLPPALDVYDLTVFTRTLRDITNEFESRVRTHKVDDVQHASCDVYAHDMVRVADAISSYITERRERYAFCDDHSKHTRNGLLLRFMRATSTPGTQSGELFCIDLVVHALERMRTALGDTKNYSDVLYAARLSLSTLQKLVLLLQKDNNLAGHGLAMHG